jgi:hypothetical protein
MKQIKWAQSVEGYTSAINFNFLTDLVEFYVTSVRNRVAVELR